MSQFVEFHKKSINKNQYAMLQVADSVSIFNRGCIWVPIMSKERNNEPINFVTGATALTTYGNQLCRYTCNISFRFLPTY